MCQCVVFFNGVLYGSFLSIDEQGFEVISVIGSNAWLQDFFNVAFVYRLGLQVFILARGVRFPYAMPFF